jgi:hypothetical protein
MSKKIYVVWNYKESGEEIIQRRQRLMGEDGNTAQLVSVETASPEKKTGFGSVVAPGVSVDVTGCESHLFPV